MIQAPSDPAAARPLWLPVDAASIAARGHADPVDRLAHAISASAALLVPGAERTERLALVTAFAISAFVPVSAVGRTKAGATRRALTEPDRAVDVTVDGSGMRYGLDAPGVSLFGHVTSLDGGSTLRHEALLRLSGEAVILRCELATTTRRTWPRFRWWVRTGGTVRADDGTRVSVVRVSGNGHIEGGIGPDPTLSVWGSLERGLIVESFRTARID